MNLKSKPFGILLIGVLIVSLGAINKILKFGNSNLFFITGLIVEIIGIYIFFKWYVKMRRMEKSLKDNFR